GCPAARLWSRARARRVGRSGGRRTGADRTDRRQHTGSDDGPEYERPPRRHDPKESVVFGSPCPGAGTRATRLAFVLGAGEEGPFCVRGEVEPERGRDAVVVDEVDAATDRRLGRLRG